MIAPAAAAPPAILASLPLLDPAVTSKPVASMRKVFPSTRIWSKEATRRALPFTRPERRAVTTCPITSEPGGQEHVAVDHDVLGQLGHDTVLRLARSWW